jgi:uncharacterized membrane protein YraQ (UPF0718 family)
MNKRLIVAIRKSARSIWKSIPVLLGIIMLISLANTIIPKELYSKIFSGNYVTDPLIGSSIGSILTGNPITSYVIGGELLKQGVSLIAIVAFLVSWVTVGIIQLPAESLMLGKRFALKRNILSFLFSILVATITVILLSVV